QLETYRAAREALQAEQDQLEADRERLEQQRVEAMAERQRIVAETKLTDVVGALAEDPDVRAAVGKVAQSTGFTPAVEELSTMASELRTTAGYMTALWRQVRRPGLLIGLLAAFAVLTAFGVALLIRGGSVSFGSAITVAVAITGVVAGIARL